MTDLDDLLHEATYQPPHPDPVGLVRGAVRRSTRRRRLVGVVAAVAVLAVAVPSVAALVSRDPVQQLLPPASETGGPTDGDCGTFVLGLVDQTMPKSADDCFTSSAGVRRLSYTEPLPDGRWSLVTQVVTPDARDGVQVTVTVPSAPGSPASRTEQSCESAGHSVTVQLPDLPDLSGDRALIPRGDTCEPAVEVPFTPADLDLLPRPAGTVTDLAVACGPTDAPGVAGRIDAPAVGQIVLLRPDGWVAGRTSEFRQDGQFFAQFRTGRLNVANFNLAETWIEARDTDGNLLLSRQLPYPLPSPGGPCG